MSRKPINPKAETYEDLIALQEERIEMILDLHYMNEDQPQ
jgi:hypothetical protein